MSVVLSVVFSVLGKIIAKLAPVILHELFSIAQYLFEAAKEKWLPPEVKSQGVLVAPTLKAQVSSMSDGVKEASFNLFDGLDKREKTALVIASVILLAFVLHFIF